MSVESVSEIMEGQEAKIVGTTITAVRRFLVTLSAPATDGALQACLAYNIPKRRDKWPEQYDGFTRPVATDITAIPYKSDQTRRVYVVTVDYTNDGVEYGGGGEADPDTEKAPWEKDAVISYDSIEYTAALEKDYSTPPAAVVNSVGDPFDPPPEVVRTRTKITIQFASTAVRSTLVNVTANYVGMTNSTTVTIDGQTYTPNVLKLTRYNVTSAEWVNPDGGAVTDYNEVVAEIEVNQDTWLIEIRNQGYRARPSAGQEPVVVMDNGRPRTVPTLLASDGTATSASSPNYITFKQYPETDFSTIPLGL